jgi:hypothetical protein
VHVSVLHAADVFGLQIFVELINQSSSYSVLRRIFGSKRDEVMGDEKTLQ